MEWHHINTAWLLSQFQNGSLQSCLFQDEFRQDSWRVRGWNFCEWKRWMFTCYRWRQKSKLFWVTFKKILYIGFRATLKFCKFKVALNPIYRIFLNLAKSSVSWSIKKNFTVLFLSTVKPVLSGPHIKWTPAWIPKFSSHLYSKINLHSADVDTHVKSFCDTKPAITDTSRAFYF